jgi:FkbM family methyltransferase
MTRYAKDSRIIFDLGTNDGEDTAFYLKRGFNVVALEANPVLCDKGRQRFQNEISQGRLSLLNVAIADRPGQAKFYVNLENDHWSSLNAEWAGRDATKFKEISVECVTVRSLFAEFGVPYYLKIDVEGADQSVLEQLRHVDTLPLFVSVEDCRLGFDYMRIMASCGYNAFKLLDQSGVAQMTDAATGSSSRKS